LALKAFGEYQSDNTYFTDFSPNLDEQLNRSLKSQATVSKKFDNGVSATATFLHTENLDYATRTDQLPKASVSLPTVFLFGNGSRDADGKLQQKWYHSFAFRYTPNLLNFSSRRTDTTVYDHFYIDNDTVVTTQIKRPFRSRKKYVSITHRPALTLPRIKLGPYVNIVPGFGYSETWVKIIRTDQSDLAGVEPGTYRTYTWNTGVSASTKLYGTVYPNVGSLLGLRHVIEPRVSYGYRPEIDRHPEIRKFAAGVSSTKSSSIAVSLNQNLQAKVKSGDTERSLNLLDLKTGFGYNFEADEKPLSNLTTTFQSTAVPNVSISGGMTHSFYDPDTDELSFWSPFRQSFNFRTSLNLKGIFPFFDEAAAIPRGADSASQLGDLSTGSSGGGGKGSWSCKLDYNYSESGRGASWSKTSSFFVQMSVNFNLTPTTRVTYAQRYDFLRSKTVSNSVSIVKKLHCWSGSLYWVPVGPNRGFGFKLFVTEMPEIKIDNGHDSFTSGLQRIR
jgi:hypothetical protein